MTLLESAWYDTGTMQHFFSINKCFVNDETPWLQIIGMPFLFCNLIVFNTWATGLCTGRSVRIAKKTCYFYPRGMDHLKRGAPEKNWFTSTAHASGQVLASFEFHLYALRLRDTLLALASKWLEFTQRQRDLTSTFRLLVLGGFPSDPLPVGAKDLDFPTPLMRGDSPLAPSATPNLPPTLGLIFGSAGGGV